MTVEELIKRLEVLDVRTKVFIEVRTEHPVFSCLIESTRFDPGEVLRCPHEGCTHGHEGVGSITLSGTCGL